MSGSIEFHRVAKTSDLADGSMISAKIGSVEVLVARIGDDYFAIDAWCSHEAGYLLQGILHAKLCEVECPIHESTFDLRTGESTMPPAEDPVLTFPVKIEGDDVLVGTSGES